MRLINVLSFPLLFSSTVFGSASAFNARADNSTVQWGSCGGGHDSFQCANISVPLDYHNASDPRTINIYITRLPATNTTNKLGSLFINPGGPGASGSDVVFEFGQNITTFLMGQYDIIGFDPRGVKRSEPYISCFDNLLDEDLFSHMTRGLTLNIPSNITDEVVGDLDRQLTSIRGQVTSLSAQCYARVGDFMSFIGSEAVARDIDTMSKAIDGPDVPINYYGLSYGSALGQRLVQILPPSRIGRVVIDAIVNPVLTSKYAFSPLNTSVSTGDILQGFADNCASAGDACALLNMTSTDIISKINSTLDSLYYNPVHVTDLGYPAVADAGILREVMFRALYSVQTWPMLAEVLAAAFAGNYTPAVSRVLPSLSATSAMQPDDSSYAGTLIVCNDALSTAQQTAADLMLSLRQNSPQLGESAFSLGLCGDWPDVYPSHSRYNGTFGLPDHTLKTPILMMSNTYDPITPLVNAINSLELYGNNARLIQQADGYGHGAISAVSFCTLQLLQSYLLYGEVPETKHTICQVDQKPFVPFSVSSATNSTQGYNLASREAYTAMLMVLETNL
ncbi:hypothetical protein NEOLEDRAFT_783819 [Neolentinus lepideus HHB14362 ss-1]|uniref:Alpha/beta-hydrolase n=1 Tax=Neolentinus lepideus HHB14362 ss-1 TaxID=1314782 RepID=A0A165UXI7_9AGAM|nr:hypothetical protein NEOLEDRAFT_783819 [Neolentinus lepideus HHB14362 ss-1]